MASGGAAPADLRMGTAKGRWVVAAAVLGSGVAFLDGTVVNAALPAISRDLNANSLTSSGCSRGTCSPWARSSCSVVRSATATGAAGSSSSDWSRSRHVAAVRDRPDTGMLIGARASKAWPPRSRAQQPGDGLGVVRRRRPRPCDRRVVGLGGIAPPSARSSVAISSTPCRGDGCSSSTCRSSVVAILIALRHVPGSRDDMPARTRRGRERVLDARTRRRGLRADRGAGPRTGPRVDRGRGRRRRHARRVPRVEDGWRTRWCRSGSSSRSSSRARTR